EGRGGSVPGKGCRCRSAAGAVLCRTGSTTIFAPGASRNQCLWACGAEVDGFAPQTITHLASMAVRGSKPMTDVPSAYCRAAWPAMLQMVSGSIDVAPNR